MTLSRLVWANIRRNKKRTILTTLSVMVAFFLFGVLRSVLTTLDRLARRIEGAVVARAEEARVLRLPVHATAEVGADAGERDEVARALTRTLARDRELRSRRRAERLRAAALEALHLADQHPSAARGLRRVEEASADVGAGAVARGQSAEHHDLAELPEEGAALGLLRFAAMRVG